MKRYLFVLSLLVSTQAFACQLKIAIRDAAFYSAKDENGHWQGIDIEIYRYLADAISCDIEYVEVPFSDAVKLLKSGGIDAMTQLSILPDRLEHISFVGPVRREIFSLVTTADISETITSFDDIVKYPYLFAKRKGTYLGREFHHKYAREQLFSSKFIELSTVHPRINLIIKKRVYGFFDESNYLKYALANSPKYKGLKIHPLSIDNGEIFIGFSNKSLSQETIAQLNRAFFTLKSSKKIAELHAGTPLR